VRRARWVLPFSRQFAATAVSLAPLVPWAWKMAALRWWLARSFYRPAGLAHLVPDCAPADMLFTGAPRPRPSARTKPMRNRTLRLSPAWNVPAVTQHYIDRFGALLSGGIAHRALPGTNAYARQCACCAQAARSCSAAHALAAGALPPRAQTWPAAAAARQAGPYAGLTLSCEPCAPAGQAHDSYFSCARDGAVRHLLGAAAEVDEAGVRLADGRHLPADIVVFCGGCAWQGEPAFLASMGLGAAQACFKPDRFQTLSCLRSLHAPGEPGPLAGRRPTPTRGLPLSQPAAPA